MNPTADIKVSIVLSLEEIQTLVGHLDVSTKVQGLQGASTALPLVVKLLEALNIAVEKQNNNASTIDISTYSSDVDLTKRTY